MIGQPLMGILIGDVVGSAYEIAPPQSLSFSLYTSHSHPTDDTVLTLAVADAVIKGKGNPQLTKELTKTKLVEAVETWPKAGYGARFLRWALCSDLTPYNSWANGAAMRVASVAWVYNTLDDIEAYAKITAEVTHNHPDAIRGAQTVAGLIWLAKQGYNKEDLLYYATNCKGYDVSQAATDWSILNDHNAQQVLAKRKTRSAVYSIPRCIRAFLESENFEEAIRLAVCLGGDTDTQGSITCGIAEVFYREIPDEIGSFKALLGGLGRTLKQLPCWELSSQVNFPGLRYVEDSIKLRQ